jgi:phasin family protein
VKKKWIVHYVGPMPRLVENRLMLQCNISVDIVVRRTYVGDVPPSSRFGRSPFGPTRGCDKMIQNFEDVQKMSKEHLDAATASASTWTKGVQEIAAQTTDYSKKSFEATQGLFEKLLSIKTLDKAMEVQTDFAKQAYEGLVAQSTKVTELYTNLFKDAMKPVEQAFAKVQAAAK